MANKGYMKVSFPGCKIKGDAPHPQSYRPDLPLRSKLPLNRWDQPSKKPYPKFTPRCS